MELPNSQQSSLTFLSFLCALFSLAAHSQTSQTITLSSGTSTTYVGATTATSFCNSPPPVGGTSVASIVSSSGYSIIGGTQWINSIAPAFLSPTYSNVGYTTTFSLPSGFTAPSLAVSVYADNVATVFLNGSQIGQQQCAETTANFTGAPAMFTTSNVAFFHTGMNTIGFNIYNFCCQAGFDYQAAITFSSGNTACALSTITVTPPPLANPSLNVPNTEQFTATGTCSDGSTQNLTSPQITWSSSDPNVATIDATTGLATAIYAGTTAIIATDLTTGVYGSFDLYVGCSVTLAHQWNQGAALPFGGPWAGQTYDNYTSGGPACSPTHPKTDDCPIRKFGCATTSLAMALSYAGFESTPDGSALDPGTLNTWMKNNGDYDERHNVMFDMTVADFSPTHPPLLRNTYFDQYSFSPFTLDDLEKKVCTGNKGRHVPVIVKVPGGTPRTNPGCSDPNRSHYVLVTGVTFDVSGRHFPIADPDHVNVPNCAGVAPTKSLDDYLSFQTRGFIYDPEGDISRLVVAVSGAAEALITDSLGERLGYDPATQKDLKEIVNSNYFRDAIADDVTGELPLASDVTHTAGIFHPGTGSFQFLVTGLELGAYTLYVDGFSEDGSLQPEIVIQGVASTGSSDTYLLQYSPVPGQSVTVKKQVTFASLRSELHIEKALSQVGNRKFVRRLDGMLEEGQEAIERGRVEEAVESLHHFVRDLFKAATKASSRDEDQDSEEAKRFVTSGALHLLSMDAETLIADLGRKRGGDAHDDASSFAGRKPLEH